MYTYHAVIRSTNKWPWSVNSNITDKMYRDIKNNNTIMSKSSANVFF